MARKPRRRDINRLRFEPLEVRSMLAVAAFAVKLYHDQDGVIGTQVSLGEVMHEGDKFFAEITAEEFDPALNGFQGVALDISWNPNVLKEIDSPFSPAALITPDLPLFQTGTLHSQAGVIQDLGGSSFTSSGIGRLIGNGVADRFALLHFEAIVAGTSSLALAQGGSAIATQPTTALHDNQIDFQSASVTVHSLTVLTDKPDFPVLATTNTPLGPAPILVPPSDAPPSAAAEAPAVSAPTSPTAPPAPGILLQTNYYTSSGGQPGSLIADHTLAVGQDFFVEIVAQDLRSSPQGIGGLSVDVRWNSAAIQEVDSSFHPTDAGSPVVTDAFPLFRSGSLDNAAGQIRNLSGAELHSTGSGAAIGVGTPQRFSLLHFRATAAGDATLSLAVGAGGAGLIGMAAGDTPTVSATPQALAVVASQPPRISVAGSSDGDASTVQFNTTVGGGVSALTRPAFPDSKQYIDITNTGGSPLAIASIRINVPEVTVDTAASAGLSIAAGETRRIRLTYAPSTPNPQNFSPESFHQANGLVILSNAQNAAQVQVGLVGASTFDSDINYDGRVNLTDLVLLDDHIGARAGSANYDRAIDPNGDGHVDLADFGPLNVYFGHSLPVATSQAAAVGAPASAVGIVPPATAAAVAPVVTANGAVAQSSLSGATPAAFMLPRVNNSAAVDAAFAASDASDGVLGVVISDLFLASQGRSRGSSAAAQQS